MAAVKSSYTSDELFHLVGREHPTDDEANYRRLLSVLNDACISHRPHKPNWGKVSYTIDIEGSLRSGDLIVATVTCFCDIRLEHLELHTAKYGKFGLSFRRELLVQYGARPVTYVPLSRSHIGGIHGPNFLRDLEAVYRGFRRHLVTPYKGVASPSRSLGAEPKTVEAAVAAVQSIFEKDVLAFIKPFDADLPDADVNNYYLEREWRKFGNLRFDPTSVERVLVARGFEARVTHDMPSYAAKVTAL